MSKTKSIKKNYIFNLIYQLTLIIVPIIVTPYSSRALLADGVGKYSFCVSIITYFVLFASFGFDIYAQREIAKHQNDKKAQTISFWNIFLCKVFTTCISLSVFLILFFTNTFGNHSNIMLILIINLVSVAFEISFFFQGNEEFGKIVTRNIIIKIISASGIFIFVKNPNDLWKYTLIHSLMSICSNISLWPLLKKYLIRINVKELKPFKHLKGAFLLFVPTIAISIYAILDKTLIGLITKSNAQNGYYEQAEKIVKMALTLVTCLGFVMIPRNTNEIAKGNHKQVKTNIYTASNFVWLLGIPLTLGIILIADNMVPWFLGESFKQTSLLLKIFSPLIIFIGFSNILGQQYMIPYNKDKQYTTSIICGSISNIILNTIFISLWGAFGATFSTIISEFIVTLVMYIFLRKELSIKSIMKSSIKPLVAGCVMFLITYPITKLLTPTLLNTLIIILIGAIIYAAAIIILQEKLATTYLKNFITKILTKIKKENNIMYDYLIVGSGLFGAVIANELKQKGKKILVIDKRNHIGGNIYTEQREGINVHKYGAHIFHTSNKEVWDYMNQFAEFNRFTNSPIAVYKNELYNLPFNMNTFSKMWNIKTPNEAKEIIEKQKAEFNITNPQNLEEKAISLVGKDIYEKLVKGYTEKQWGKDCKELPAFIINRLPLRFTYDNNYFNDKYQGIPVGGYTQIIKKMLDGVDIKLNVDYLDKKDYYNSLAKNIIYTGRIDKFYDCQFGSLEYRSLRFEEETLDTENYQGNAVVNYTEYEVPYTRIIEHKHFEGSSSPKTIITREYPLNWDETKEPYYTVNNDRNNQLYAKYKELAEKETNVYFGGRLGDYKYYDMHVIVEKAFELLKNLK